MDAGLRVLMFGDQTGFSPSHLRELLRIRADPILETFLRISYNAIRTELLHSSQGDLKNEWQFSSLVDLLEINPCPGRQRVALDLTLTTICHFGFFFDRCNKDGRYPDPSSVQYVGLCVGGLAAATVSCCKSTSQLLPVAVEVCVLAFRAGILAANVAAQFNNNGIEGDWSSWAMAIPNVDAKDISLAIDRFLQVKGNIPRASTPFISTISLRSLTVCGPPHVLAEFRDWKDLRNALPLPLYAPYHCEHLYSLTDIHELVNTLGFSQWDHFHTSPGLLIGTRSGADNVPHTLRHALIYSLKQIFLNCSDHHEIFEELKSALLASTPSTVTFIPILSNGSQDFFRALNAASLPNVSLAEIPQLCQNSTDDRSYAASQSSSRAKIAIIGASCRLPGADDVEEFWDLLRDGRDVHKVVPTLRWDAKTHVDVSSKPQKNTSATPYGCWLEEPGMFDAKFFGMSPREAEQTDPAQRLALMTAYEALEDAGIVPGVGSSQRDRVGVCYGVTSNDWMETNSAQNIDTFLIPGGNRAFIPGRISYFFKFSGPSLVIDTACSSSAMAIHTACNILRRDEADIMVCGGTNILTNPDFTAGLDRGHFLSRTGNCKTFDEEADGYCRGEGVGTVILKRLDDAIRDRDPIKAVILNACTNHNAEAVSMTRPCVAAQRHLFTKVLDGLQPAHVSYVEMHGTGTQVGDATEMASVLEALAPSSGPCLRSETPVHVGSVKSNLGHGEAAAGITSLIKLLLMMRNNMIPPHIGIRTRINSKFPHDLESRGVRIATAPVSWPRSGAPRTALLNNFSAAGGNSVLLLQDGPPEDSSSAIDPRRFHPVTLSAKTYSALLANAHALLSHIRQHPALHLPSLSYTSTARRLHHAHRMVVNGESLQTIATGISQAIENGTGKTKPLKSTLVMAFTGQGSHYIGMGRDLYKHLADFREDINHFDRIAVNEGFSSFLPLIRDSEGDPDSFSPEAVQLAIVCLQMALTRLWASWGVSPDAVIGHSLGHYAALAAAGVLSPIDTIFVVGTRARHLQTKCRSGTHGMLLVRNTVSAVERYLDGTHLEIACINGPLEVVLGGAKADIEHVRSRLVSDGISCQILDIPFAFHSSQVDCFLAGFASSISSIKFAPSRLPILCPLTAQVVETGAEIGPGHLVDHCRKQVDFCGAIKAGEDKKLVTKNTIFVEIGHHRSFRATIQALPSLAKRRDPWSTLTEALGKVYMAGYDVKWDKYHGCFARNLHVVSLPHYKWDLKHFWIQYVNDWSLHKGDPKQITQPGPTIMSSMIHQVIREDIDPSLRSGSVIVRTDLSAPQLLPIVQGHKVDGFPLSTPSIYADIALTVARYIQNRPWSPAAGKAISIDKMSIERALIANSTSPQWLQSEIKVAGTDNVGFECRFSSVRPDGSLITNHAHCMISFAQPPKPSWLERKCFEARTQIGLLRQKITAGQAYRFNTNMIYRMVATLAEFGPSYRALQEVALDSEAMAAASRINFGLIPLRDSEAYAAHPACVDALTQSAGFVMNANEASNPEVECFVNHGWESLRLYEELKRDGIYESFVQMTRGESNMWRGDLYVVRGDGLAAVIEGVKLQGVPRRLLRQVLSAAHKMQSTQETHSDDDLSPKHTVSEEHYTVKSKSQEHLELQAALSKIDGIIAEESGISRVEILDDTDFANIGVDSLLSLLITARLKEDLGYDIGPTISIFDRFRTTGELKAGYINYRARLLPRDDPRTNLGDNGLVGEITAAESVSHESSESHVKHSKMHLAFSLTNDRDRTPARAVTSIVLHKATVSPDEAEVVLFLFPDGSGSVASYTQIPPVSSHVTLIGLVCPYRRDPEEMTCSLETLMALYTAEIRRRQPCGPYSLGGWSTGGVLAYRAAQALLDAGFGVRDVVLIDSPAPNGGVQPLPTRFYEHCRKTGIFAQIGDHETDALTTSTSTRESPTWLIPHFRATVELLAGYHAAPLQIPPDVAGPRVALCWAGRTALDGHRYGRFEWREGDGEGVRFLSEARTDFGAGGWGQLVPPNETGDGIYTEVLHEWDHFGIMCGDGARALARFLARALQVTA